MGLGALPPLLEQPRTLVFTQTPAALQLIELSEDVRGVADRLYTALSAGESHEIPGWRADDSRPEPDLWTSDKTTRIGIHADDVLDQLVLMAERNDHPYLSAIGAVIGADRCEWCQIPAHQGGVLALVTVMLLSDRLAADG